MQGIGGFLKKYLNLAPPTQAMEQAVLKAISERFGDTEGQSVAVRRGIAYVSGPGALKSEIALQKIAILSRVAELMGEKGLSDIR